MSKLNNINRYFNEKERKKLNAETQEVGGLPIMSAAEIRLTCLENDGYETPELNEKLYLHFRGFRKIENLEPYVNCKALWLESNGFDKIEGLETLIELRCLYLAKNLISAVEGLSTLRNLSIIDLSNNRITHLSGLSECPNLQTINLSKNSFSTAESLQHLTECKAVENVDLTNCNIPADETIFDVLTSVQWVMNLALNGNELTKLPHFRKKLITALPKLHYLDRPIEELERLRSAAFVDGGAEAEKACVEQHRAEKEAKRREETTIFRNWQKEHREKAKAEKERKLAEQALARERGEQVEDESDSVQSSVTALTAEEQAAYRADSIQRAKDAEKEMLDLGVDRIGKKYWELEALDKTKSADQLMRESVEAVKQEDARQKAEQAELNRHATLTAEEEDNADAALIEEMLVGPNSTEPVQESEPVPPEEPQVPRKSAAEVELERQMKQYKFDIDGEDGVKDDDVLEDSTNTDKADEDAVVAEVDLDPGEDTPEMQQLRQQRIDESLYIFNKQMELKKLKAHPSNTQGNLAPHLKSSTWDQPAQKECTRREEPDVTAETLFWTETMDLALARHVKDCFFDFGLVSTKLIALQKRGLFSEQLNRYNPTVEFGANSDVGAVEKQSQMLSLLLSGDACRLRWAELDANRWSVPGNGITSGGATLPQDVSEQVNHTVFVRPTSITGGGHGSQPSFEQLAQQASGDRPGYLKKPMSFPSVRSNPNDVEDEDLDALD